MKRRRARSARYCGGSYATHLPRASVRLTSLLRQLIGLEATIVVGVEFDVVGLVVDVRPSNRIPTLLRLRPQGLGHVRPPTAGGGVTSTSPG